MDSPFFLYLCFLRRFDFSHFNLLAIIILFTMANGEKKVNILFLGYFLYYFLLFSDTVLVSDPVMSDIVGMTEEEEKE